MKNKRLPLMAANWKCNQRWEDCEQFVSDLSELLPELFTPDAEPAVEVLVCPPFPYLALLGTLLEDAAVYIGGQDVSRFTGGAFTGDVAAGMLDDLQCDYCIVGHSERRNVFGDTDEIIAAKLACLQEVSLLPVLCVGESLATREAGEAVSFTLGQLKAVKSQLAELETGQLVVAYEPVWAIGTGRNAGAADAQEMCGAIRDWLSRNLSAEAAAATPILYGGSVKPDNAREYFAQPDVDGALVGGASLQADSFAQLIKALRG